MEKIKPKANAKTAADHSEGLNFHELLQIIKLRKKLLYTFTIMAILGTLFRQVFYIPLYTANSALSVQKVENSPMQLALANLGTTQFDTSDRLKKYLEYIQSKEFFLAVAQQLKFQEGYNLLNLTTPSDMSMTKRNFWKQFLSTHFGSHPSGSSNSAVPEPVLVPVEQLAEIIAGVTSADASGTDTIHIHVTTMDPFTSMVLVNSVTEVFVKKTAERDYNEVNEVKRFIQERLEATTEKLKSAEGGLIDFKKQHNILSINGENTAFSQKLSNVENELETTKLKYQENLRLIQYYEKALQKSENSILAKGAGSIQATGSEIVNRLREELDNLRRKKVLMLSQGYQEGSWQMGEMNGEIDRVSKELKQALGSAANSENPGAKIADAEDAAILNLGNARGKVNALRNDNRALEAKIASLEKSRSELLKHLGTLPKDEQALLTLSRDVDLQFELYSSLKKKLQEVEIQQVALQSHVTITERSPVPAPVARANILIKFLFALLVGGFMGSTVAFLLEAIDPTIKHISDLEKMELTTLGAIPHVEGSAIRQNLGGQSYRPDLLICKEKPESPESMAFKYIRAQISNQRAPDGNKTKVIVITSPDRGDGKSFVAGNLAVSLGQLEKPTLLIDADFRNPSIPYLFGYREGAGLSSVLNLKSTLDEVLLKDRAHHLDILPAGWSPPNPTELVSNEKFRVLLEHLKDVYEYIVIDAPPVVPVVDAAVMANHSDCVILTAGFRKTRKDMALQGIKKILQVSNRHIFAVLNNVWEVSDYSEAYESRVTNFTQEPIDSKSELEKFEQSLRERRAG